jgi:hypothetical protein
MNGTNLGRDWPPPPKPKPDPPSLRVGLMLLTIMLLLLGSPLVAWLVATLDHPWWPVIVPTSWLAALVVFLVGSFIDIRIRSRK